MNDTTEPTNTIGNGVVIAHAVTVAAITVAVALGEIETATWLGAFLGLFAAVFIGDMALKAGVVGRDDAPHDRHAPADD